MPPRLGDLLVSGGAITRDQLGEALRHQARAGGRLDESLMELGFVDAQRMCAVVASELRIPQSNESQVERVGRATLSLVRGELAIELRVVPVREDQGRLWVAMADPTDRDAIEKLEKATLKPIRPLAATGAMIQRGLELHYGAAPAPSRPPPIPMSEPIESGGLLSDSALRPLPSSAPLGLFGGLAGESTGFLDEAARPRAPRAARPLAFDELVQRFSTAASEEQVLESALDYVAQTALGACLLLLRSGELRLSGARGIDLAAARSRRVPLAEVPLAAQALQTGELYAALLSPSGLGPFAAPLGITGELAGVIVPVRIGRRPVGVIVGIDLAADSDGPRLDRLPAKLDHALHILHLRRLLLTP